MNRQAKRVLGALRRAGQAAGSRFLRLSPPARTGLVTVGGAAAGALIVLGGALAYGSISNLTGGTLNADAQRIMNQCEKTSYPPACYDKEIPKLMDQGLSMEDAFKVTAIIQTHVSDYYYCHILGHELASKETAKDPSKWTQVIARCPVGQCSNGCLHGAAQERFRNDVLTPEQQDEVVPQLKTVCTDETRNFTGLEQASCFHSLGHLSMYITGANIRKSLSNCDAIAHVGATDFTQTCYEGAFMQIFQPLEPEDFGLVKDIAPTTTAKAETFCDAFSGEPRAACHRESWPLYLKQIETGPGLQKFCALVQDPTDVSRCYNGIFFVLMAEFNFDTSKVLPICTTLPEKRMAQCFANSAARLVETDYRLGQKAVDLCGIADQHGVGQQCYDLLLYYSTFNYHEGTPAFEQFCGYMPEPYRDECLAGKGSTINPYQY